LLARAASYAKHRDNYSTLFHIDTMEPLVAGPPFVRALEELAAAAKFGPSDPLGADPAAAREAFWRGECGMALTWPSAAAKFPPGNSVRAGIAPLPGSTEAYNIGNQTWEKRSEDEDPQVPLLSIAGRIGLVSSGSQRPEAAFQLLFWLSGKQFGSQVCAPSPATTLFRRSHLESPQTWAERPMPASTAVQYAAQTATTLGRQQWLSVPAIPGNQEYLAALDDAVRQTVAGQQSATEALQQAAERWREITQRLGLESQKNAYRRSLGLP
jgi:ABC-type glycerol-3-phosphate transport system substrate-binding protein